jgi:hypothetical protein
LLAARLVGAGADDMRLETEHSRDQPPADRGQGVFWVILGGTVVVVLMLIGRLLRQENAPAG